MLRFILSKKTLYYNNAHLDNTHHEHRQFHCVCFHHILNSCDSQRLLKSVASKIRLAWQHKAWCEVWIVRSRRVVVNMCSDSYPATDKNDSNYGNFSRNRTCAKNKVFANTGVDESTFWCAIFNFGNIHTKLQSLAQLANSYDNDGRTVKPVFTSRTGIHTQVPSIDCK